MGRLMADGTVTAEETQEEGRSSLWERRARRRQIWGKDGEEENGYRNERERRTKLTDVSDYTIGVDLGQRKDNKPYMI